MKDTTMTNKPIATLQRRLIALRDRIVQLDYWLTHHSDHKHADLSHELVSVGALSDLANEWCAEFEETDRSMEDPSELSAHCQQAPNVQASEKVATSQLTLNV